MDSKIEQKINRNRIWLIIQILAFAGLIFLALVSIQRINPEPSENPYASNPETPEKTITLQQKTEQDLVINVHTDEATPDSMRVTNNQEMERTRRKIRGAALEAIMRQRERAASYKYLVTFGTAMLIAGTCFCIGSLAGFLFGIPRIITSSVAQRPVSNASQGTVIHNDNLVQISDWLTKIIVGVGLTQINKAPQYLDQLGSKLGPSFNKPGDDHIGATIALCIVLYFLILGFVACYLWTRFHFSEMLKDSLRVEPMSLPGEEG